MGCEVIPLLRTDALLNDLTLLEEIQRRHPGSVRHGLLRTLQRRMRVWGAFHGAERDIYFAQQHPPGRFGLSDVTVCHELGVEIGGTAFLYRLYQFALAHSGWRHAEVSFGGESFLALSGRLQAALWRLGGVPQEHRIDSLSAAFDNVAEQETLTRRYDDLCRHQGTRASRCKPDQSNQNRLHRVAAWLAQYRTSSSFTLRGSWGFDDRPGYEAFVDLIVQRFNVRAAKRLAVERPMLKSLPTRRTGEYEELPARVSKYAIFTVQGARYGALASSSITG